MTDTNQEAAKYRTERNNTLVQLEGAKALLKAAGFTDQALETVSNLTSGFTPVIENGKVTNFAFNEQQMVVLNTLVPSAQTKAPPVPDDNTAKPGAKQETEAEMTARITKSVTETLAAQAAGKAIPDSSGAIPPNAGGNTGGLTRESIEAMTPEQINANWPAVQEAMQSGALSAAA